MTVCLLQRLAPFQSASSSEESDAGSEEGSDLSDSELDVDSYFFLRVSLTRVTGVIRVSLRFSGVSGRGIRVLRVPTEFQGSLWVLMVSLRSSG